MSKLDDATHVEVRIRARKQSRGGNRMGWGAVILSDGSPIEWMRGSGSAGSTLEANIFACDACLARIGTKDGVAVFLEVNATASTVARELKHSGATFAADKNPVLDQAADALALSAMGPAEKARPASSPILGDGAQLAAFWIAQAGSSNGGDCPALPKPAAKIDAAKPSAPPVQAASSNSKSKTIACSDPAPAPKSKKAQPASTSSKGSGKPSKKSKPAKPAKAERPENWADVIIHSDGSFGEDGMGWGAIVCENSGYDPRPLGIAVGSADGGTSVKAEFMGIVAAFESLPSATRKAQVFSDCKAALSQARDALAGRLAPRGEADAWERLRTAACGIDVKLRWVKGHAGLVLNEAADIAAAHETDAASPSTTRRCATIRGRAPPAW